MFSSPCLSFRALGIRSLLTTSPWRQSAKRIGLRARILRTMDAEFGSEPVCRSSSDFAAEDDKTMFLARRPITALAPCELPRGVPARPLAPRSGPCFLRRSCLGHRESSLRHSGSGGLWNVPTPRGSRGVDCDSPARRPFAGRREHIRSSRVSGWLLALHISAGGLSL